MRIAIIGFGEAGQIYACDLAARAEVRVWDKKFAEPGAERLLARASEFKVSAATSLQQAVADASLIVSLVTAASALHVAQAIAPWLRPGQTLLDFNSVSPETKRAAAAAIATGAGDYLDVAVMAPVPPKRLGTPLLLGGAQAERIAAQLSAAGCQATAAAAEPGCVSAIKMCRSVMIKGLEALTTECLEAARRYGVEQPVLASLHASFPSLGWDGNFPGYLISRVAEHGVRRAEEMAEVVKTLQDAGLPATMSQATQQVQADLPAQLAARKLRYSDLQPFLWADVMAKLDDR